MQMRFISVAIVCERVQNLSRLRNHSGRNIHYVPDPVLMNRTATKTEPHEPPII